jgi:DNA-binding NtrC family response regulator
VKPILYLGCPQVERASTEKILAGADMSIVFADNASYALNELQRCEMPVLIDLSRGAAALQVARDLRTHRPGVLLFAVVDDRRPDLTAEAVLTGVADVFARPPAPKRLASAIEREKNYESRQPPRKPQLAADALYSHSPAMREVVAQMARAAAARTGVTIRGEEGTGRQVVARAIHAAERESAPFVSVDCAASEGEDFDAVLFGHGGHAGKPRTGEGSGPERVSRHSRLHEALGGTLYLQNVAEAPTRVQAKLARLLRDGEATLAETGATVRFDVRVMAGVDAGVDAAVEDGRVRADLFKRLSMMRIDMPPLRSRREDIPALANYFLREICGNRRIPPKTLSRPALSLISALPWRGNAIELQQMLESIVSGLAGGKGIGLEDVLAHVRLDGGSVAFEQGGTLKQARARFESEYIAHVLEQHHGRISEAAKVLGIQRTNLYRKMRSLHVAVDRRPR